MNRISRDQHSPMWRDQCFLFVLVKWKNIHPQKNSRPSGAILTKFDRLESKIAHKTPFFARRRRNFSIFRVSTTISPLIFEEFLRKSEILPNFFSWRMKKKSPKWKNLNIFSFQMKKNTGRDSPPNWKTRIPSSRTRRMPCPGLSPSWTGYTTRSVWRKKLLCALQLRNRACCEHNARVTRAWSLCHQNVTFCHPSLEFVSPKCHLLSPELGVCVSQMSPFGTRAWSLCHPSVTFCHPSREFV